jgi:ATP-binding cassette, subfamily B, multidrug efflux pump
LRPQAPGLSHGFRSQPGSGRALRRSLGFLRAHKRDIAGALCSLLVVSAANLTAPQLIRYAVDRGIAVRNLRAVLVGVAGLLAVAGARGLFNFLQGYLAERASQGVAFDIRNEMFARIQRLSFSYYDRAQTGQLLTRLTNDIEQIRSFVGFGVIQFAAAGAMLLGSIVLLVELNWRLAIAALAMIPAIFFILGRFVRRIGPLFGQVQNLLGRLNTVLQEDLSGIRIIRAFAREDYEIARYDAANQALLAKNLEAVDALANNFPFVFLFANVGTFLVVWYGGSEIIGGKLSIGELLAFNSYLAFLLMPILTVGFLAAMISRAGASSLRVFEILDAPLELRDNPGAQQLPPICGRVEFRDVRFRYPGSETEVLRGLSFVLEPGQLVAILGTTGSGKSTVVNLIPRFYEVTSGSVLVDGFDVRSVTMSSLRGQIGIALQDTLLFSGSVRDNIAFGRPAASLDEVVAAARAAQVDEFVSKLPEGYDTIIGERGIGLSGGQRQRIAIARALLVNPKLLILDDSTSAVDVETEAAIQKALDQLMRQADRTTLVIAQRISTVKDADLVLVIDQGRLAASGTHEELLRESPLYNEILGSQLQAEPDGTTEGART